MLPLIDEMESLLQRSIHVPASGKILVDEAAIRGVVDRMKLILPDEAQWGQRAVAERERVLSDARAQARRMLDEAQAQVDARLEEQSIVQAARQRAREIQHEAEQRANSLRADTNSYVVGQLAALENRLQRLLREVQGGQRTLSSEAGDQRGGSARPSEGGARS